MRFLPHRRNLMLRVASAATAVCAGALVFAPSALANFITPKAGGSPNANSIHTLYMIVLVVAAIVFVIVESALAYAVWKFRAKKHPVAHQIHGNTRLEIGWTGGAALILLVLAVVTFIKLPSIVNAPNSSSDGYSLSASVTQPDAPNGKILVICVQGRQYIWRYTYGQDCLHNAYAQRLPYSYTTMVVPAHTTTCSRLTSSTPGGCHRWAARPTSYRAIRPTPGSRRCTPGSSVASARSCAGRTMTRWTPTSGSSLRPPTPSG
jgi:cytochrome c oxidase subunit 2